MCANARARRRAAWTIAIAAAWALASAHAHAQDLDLVHATVIDGTGAPPRPGMTIHVRGGRIAAVTPTDSRPLGDAATRLDLGGRTVIPGLIDAHAHIATPDAARRALESGVTTARVLGDSHLQALGTRDLIKGGHVAGPELLVASSIIRPHPGIAFYQAYPQFGRFLRSELRGPEVIADVVRAMTARGVDVIKVGASERAGLASTDPRRSELDEAEMRAAVEAARAAGRDVAAHAHGADGVRAAVRAGVRSIEHGTYVDDETLAEMQRRGTAFVPTLAVMSPLGDPRGNSADDVALQLRTYHMMAPLRAAVRKARALGITIAAATDGSYADGEDTGRIRVAHEIELLVSHGGHTPLEAIGAATAQGATVLGIAQRTGTIEVGREADLVVFDRDPQQDLTVLFEPLIVVSDGRVVLDRRY
jgi:imidazolonepropionase-like amidohydrolase